jgi:hypothetical protein
MLKWSKRILPIEFVFEGLVEDTKNFEKALLLGDTSTDEMLRGDWSKIFKGALSDVL